MNPTTCLHGHPWGLYKTDEKYLRPPAEYTQSLLVLAVRMHQSIFKIPRTPYLPDPKPTYTYNETHALPLQLTGPLSSQVGDCGVYMCMMHRSACFSCACACCAPSVPGCGRTRTASRSSRSCRGRRSYPAAWRATATRPVRQVAPPSSAS